MQKFGCRHLIRQTFTHKLSPMPGVPKVKSADRPTRDSILRRLLPYCVCSKL